MCGKLNNIIDPLRLFTSDATVAAPAVDAATQQAAADAKAAQATNIKLAERNRRRSASLLSTGAPVGMAQAPSGKTTLGA